MSAPLALQRATLAIAAAVIAGAVLLGPLTAQRSSALLAALVLTISAAAAYVLWRTDPAWLICVALAGTMFSGNWQYVGIPGALAPDRLILIGAIAAVLLRAPPIADRPPLQLRGVHWVMVVLIVYAVGSALAAGTLWDRALTFQILQSIGVLPFLVFLVAPVVFRTDRHRRVLLATMVGMGGYLGLTAVLQTIGAEQLVFPRYITDTTVGIHHGRARGPFLEAVTNGTGLYAGAIAAGMALAMTRRRPYRVVAVIVIALCVLGMLFTETRSIWLGAIVASAVTLIAVPELRRWTIPAAVAAVTMVALALVVVPGLRDSVSERRADQATVYDRQNLNRAALNMIEARPLVGFGWGTFPERNIDFFDESPNYPVTGENAKIHNLFLTYGAELGLIGLALWIVAVVLGVGGALARRGPPTLRVWRVGLGAYALFFVLVANAVFPQAFPNLILWAWAGVVLAGAEDTSDEVEDVSGRAQRT